MSADLQKQILITKSALAMLTDIHDFKNRVSFPHSNRTGLAEAQLFGLLAGLDPTVPYYIKTCTPTTTQENGDWNVERFLLHPEIETFFQKKMYT